MKAWCASSGQRLGLDGEHGLAGEARRADMIGGELAVGRRRPRPAGTGRESRTRPWSIALASGKRAEKPYSACASSGTLSSATDLRAGFLERRFSTSRRRASLRRLLARSDAAGLPAWRGLGRLGWRRRRLVGGGGLLELQAEFHRRIGEGGDRRERDDQALRRLSGRSASPRNGLRRPRGPRIGAPARSVISSGYLARRCVGQLDARKPVLKVM